MFDAAAAENRAALLPYLMAGLPDAEASVEFFAAMAKAGADGFEVGIPYADPLMDGPVIMEAGERALAAGATVDVCLDIVTAVYRLTGLPVIVMTYANPVLRRGVDAFCRGVADAGGAGLIVADLPVDEADPFLDSASRHGLGMALFAAPTTGDSRLALIGARHPAFVYAAADLGVTGSREQSSSRVAGLVTRVRSFTDRPVVAGVGITTPDQARVAAQSADGVIVGSALVRIVLAADDAVAAQGGLTSAVASFAEAMRR
jgi:tryptophan synthase alpha chain